VLRLKEAPQRTIRLKILPAHRLIQNAGQWPESIALADEITSVSYRSLLHVVGRVAGELRSRGVQPGSTISVASADPLVTYATVLACGLLGAGWVDGRELSQQQGPVITHAFHTDEVTDPAKNSSPITADWMGTGDGIDFAELVRGIDPTVDRPWLYLRSSGTTGTPKFVSLGTEIMDARIRATSAEWAGDRAACVFLFGATAAPSLIRALSATTAGWGLIHSADPSFWRERRVSRVFGAPAQLDLIFRDAPKGPKFGKVLAGGGPVSDAQVRTLFDHFSVVANTYGSTEANVVFVNECRLCEDGSVERTTVPGAPEVELVDENGLAVDKGVEGIVRIRGRGVATGYVNNPEAESGTFKDGWFYPGDLGEDRDGVLTITGRFNDILNVGGSKVNAVLVDFALMSVPGVRDAICFTMPSGTGVDELLAFVVTESGTTPREILNEARIAALAAAGSAGPPKRLYGIERVPRSPNGKPDRKACLAIAAAARAEVKKSAQLTSD